MWGKRRYAGPPRRNCELVAVRDNLDLAHRPTERPRSQDARNFLELGKNNIVEEFLEPRSVEAVAPDGELNERRVLPIDMNDTGDGGVGPGTRELIADDIEEILSSARFSSSSTS